MYDLATLVIDEKAARSAGNVSITDEQGRVLPPSYDVVIVSDVLFFMPWAGLPPAANRFVPTSWLRASQKRLFDALTRMAKRVVVFSDHENNPYVVDFLQAMGACCEQKLRRNSLKISRSQLKITIFECKISRQKASLSSRKPAHLVQRTLDDHRYFYDASCARQRPQSRRFSKFCMQNCASLLNDLDYGSTTV